MANLSQPQVVINYISQLKKITVNRNNQPSQLIIQTDYNLNETYNFQIINKINQIVQLDANTTYQIYGTYIDAKKQLHILFYTLGVTPRDNMLSFLVNTYTSEYLNYVKNNRTPIDISIVAKQNVGGSTRSYMVLRDTALANPRGYIEGQAPTDIVYQNVFTTNVPVSGVFGAGNDINLAQELDEQEIYSFAFGDTLSTNNANQFVIGYNNEPDATKAFIVANSGNIFTVDYEGNVEAGDLDVGAISATSITVSGEDLNQVIDDKVEYLSTSIDDKLSATEDWVSNTFETKESATQTFNELEGEIDDISAFVSGLPEDIAAKADQTDVDAISSFVSGLPQDINDISNAMNQKADKNDLIELSGTVEGLAETKADLSALQEATETIAETYATKAALDDYLPRSEYVDTQYTAGEGLALSGNEFRLTAAVGGNYTAGEGLALNGNEFSLTGTVLSGSEHIQVQDNVISLIGDVGKTYTGASGIIVDDTVIGISASYLSSDTSVSDLAGYDTLALTSDLTGLATKDEISDFITEDALTGLATKDELTAYAEKTDLTDYAEKSELTAYATKDDLTGYVENDTLTSYATKQYVTDATSAFITIDDVPPGSVYGVGEGLAASGDSNNIFYLTGTVLSGGDHIKIENNIVSLTGDVGKTYTGDGGIEVNNSTNTISISANYLSSNALDDYGNKTWVETNFLSTSYSTAISENSQAIEDIQGVTGTFALKADIPADIDDFVTGDEVSGIVEDMSGTIINGLAKEEDIPTDDEITGLAKDYVDTLNIATTYALKTDVPTGLADWESNTNKNYISGLGFITSQQVQPGTVYSTSFGLAASGDSNNIFYLTAGVADLSGYDTLALKSEIPSTVAELTDSSDYAQTSALTAYLEKATSGEFATSGQMDELSTQVQGLPTTDDIPTSAQITGYAYDVTTATVTKEYINSLGVDGTTYTAGAGLALDETNDKHEFYLTATIPSNDAISGIAEDVVESLSTTIRTGLATTDQLIDDEDVSGIVEDMSGAIINGLATESDVTTAISTSSGTIVDAATGSITVPTKISDLTNDSNFISAIQLTVLSGTTQVETVYTSALALASTDFFSFNDEIYIREDVWAKKTDITSALTGYATTGYVTGYCSSFITEADLPTKVSQLQNDTGFITNASLSSVYSLLSGVNVNITQAQDGTITLSTATGGGGGGSTYTAGTGIDISAQDEISVKLSAAQNGNIQVTTSNGVIYLSAAPGGGGGGDSSLTGVSELANDAGYVTTNDLTNRQRITTNSQVYNKNIEVYQNEYTPSTSAITLSAFTVSDLTELPVTAAVATFEEWVSTTTPITGITLDANLSSGLIGELPTSYTSGYYYVFVRRIINTGSSTKQYISFAYEFEKPTVQ